MNILKYIFSPNHIKYEGVRPINIYLLRIFYTLIAVFVSMDTWPVIMNHQGDWNVVFAAAFCMWATYPILLIFGIFNPLKWLPLLFFIIVYKSIWVIVVAYPLWAAGQLAGSSAEEMAGGFFIGAIILSIAMPWTYMFKTYIWPVKNKDNE